jgi:hypothetical protein
MEVYLISSDSKTLLANLPSNVKQEIQAMLVAAELANNETRTNMNMLVQQERQLLLNSGVAESKDVLRGRVDVLKVQMNTKREDVETKRRAYESAYAKFVDHLNGEQRIEIVTQSDLERNRSQDVIKTKLMSECLTQFRSVARSLYSRETSKVLNFQLHETLSKLMFRRVRLQAARILGIYLSSSDGDIKYTASIAFRFGFDYMPVTSGVTSPNPIRHSKAPWRFRSKPTSLSIDQAKAMLIVNGFYDKQINSIGMGITNNFELQNGRKVIFDRSTGLMWQQSGSSNPMHRVEAEKYVRDLNSHGFAGYNNWRLPTLDEAMSLMEPSRYGDLFADPRFDKNQRWIWTADEADASATWVVNFYDGYCYRNFVDIIRYYVRAVR